MVSVYSVIQLGHVLYWSISFINPVDYSSGCIICCIAGVGVHELCNCGVWMIDDVERCRAMMTHVGCCVVAHVLSVLSSSC